jgi:hypothetical protein
MPWFGVVAILVSFAVRGSAAWGETAQRYPDSIGYDTLKFFSPTDRPWPIPFIYAIAGSDSHRVVAQIVIGTFAWGALAWVLASTVKWQRSVFVATLLLGLTPQVIRYDVAILSESLSISFTVLAVASTLHRLRVRSALSTTWWATSLTLCVMSRPTHLFIVVACLVPVTWRFMATKGKNLTAGAIGILVLLLFSVFTIQQSQHMSLLNLYTVVSSRVITDDSRFNWFVEHGMPVSDGMRTATGYDYANDLPTNVASIVQLPEGQQPPSLMRVGGVELATWLQDNGWRTVVMYLITHPSDTLTHVANLANATLNAPNGDFLPLQNGPMIPWTLASTWQVWTLILITSCGVSLVKRSSRQHAIVLLAMFLTTMIVYATTVHTSGIEHVRHSSTVAAIIRVLGLVALVGILPKKSLSQIVDEDDEKPS